MQLFRKKRFQICIILILGITSLLIIIGIIGYKKASSIIEEFSKDFKKISESKVFNELLGALKTAKLATFINSGLPKKRFFIVNFENSTNLRKRCLTAIESRNTKSFSEIGLPSGIFETKNVDLENIPKVLDNIGFFAKIGFWFKDKKNLKTTEEITDFFRKHLIIKADEQEKLIFINLSDEECVKVHEIFLLDSDEIKFGTFQSFKFEHTKHNNNESYDYVAYIVIKATNGKIVTSQ